ncbi:rod shape-determining protein MreD [Paenibacillus sp. GSMTC-2017]|uniref:rod shape-determining protein MreD n=1 Tax=Paenibacillus sp. GSMTC-2017 TaxID=2794350 RepID=UPI0018D9CD58|nr:rod shape-determining protein MreD [Paenibacillus sp. GSMTC-2017]MBH5317155.1 rod shape-determining protein MreD [Paenibacillus sp. GSMTC-2017]
MSMNRIVCLMLLLFVIEGTLIPWIIPEGFGDRIIPHFIFVVVLFSALYGNRHQALFLGAGFGLLQDIVYYGHLIGGHFFIMGLIGYFTGVVLERKRVTIMMALTVIGFACILYDTTLFFIYKVFRITSAEYAWALINHILPSLFLQLAFALIIYVPVRRIFETRNNSVSEKDEE